FALAGQRVGHVETDPGLDGLHPFIQVVDVHIEEAALGHHRQWLAGFTCEISHHAHYKRQLNLLFRTVEFNLVLDLHPWGAVATDELLAARAINRGCHRSLLDCMSVNAGQSLAEGPAIIST